MGNWRCVREREEEHDLELGYEKLGYEDEGYYNFRLQLGQEHGRKQAIRKAVLEVAPSVFLAASPAASPRYKTN
jgi:hypothetical protein